MSNPVVTLSTRRPLTVPSTVVCLLCPLVQCWKCHSQYERAHHFRLANKKPVKELQKSFLVVLRRTIAYPIFNFITYGHVALSFSHTACSSDRLADWKCCFIFQHQSKKRPKESRLLILNDPCAILLLTSPHIVYVASILVYVPPVLVM